VADARSIETWWLGINKENPVGPNGDKITQEQASSDKEYLKEQRYLKLVALADLRRRLEESIKDLS